MLSVGCCCRLLFHVCFVRRSLPCVVCWLMFVAYWLLCVVCCLLFDVGSLLFVACGLLVAVSCFVVCLLLCDVC